MARTTLDGPGMTDEFRNYVGDMIVESLRDGTIPPTKLLECIYYAVEPDLFAAIRAFAALGPDERLMVMSYAQRLAAETAG